MGTLSPISRELVPVTFGVGLTADHLRVVGPFSFHFYIPLFVMILLLADLIFTVDGGGSVTQRVGLVSSPLACDFISLADSFESAEGVSFRKGHHRRAV